ncbi:response regulator (plasmid) [Brevibacillus halotolerans]|nr:response regulator [Brevibacillus halotolerans]
MGKRVLIVDDAYFMRNLIKKVLKEAGYEVIDEAKNGKEGITKYFERKPDFVTMDINMPDISGIEATRQILSKDPYARIIAVTGSDSEEVKAEMMMAGAKEYLKKPFQPAFLLTKIDDLFLENEIPATQPEVEKKVVVSPISTEKVEEDFFDNLEFDLLDKPDERRDRLLVIQNNEDCIEIPEEFVAKEREKFSLTQEVTLEDKKILQEEEQRKSDQLYEEISDEDVKQEPVLDKPTRQTERAETVVEIEDSTPPSLTSTSIPPHQNDEPNSYMQIKPPRKRGLSQFNYHPYEKDVELVEPVINDSDGDISVPSAKKGFLAKLANLFTKK